MERYSRQVNVKNIGPKGQRRLQKSRVLLIGCGGLGTNIANILVRAGLGFIRIIDMDTVELSNLQRQSLYSERDARDSLPKAEAAYRALTAINSEVDIEPVTEEIGPKNIEGYLRDVELVMDGTDNFATRFIINRACVENKKPWIHGGVLATSGVVINFTDLKGPCLECIYPGTLAQRELPGTKTKGVLGTLTSVVGALEANEAIKYLTGNIGSMMKGMFHMDLWDNTFQRIDIMKREDCPRCK